MKKLTATALILILILTALTASADVYPMTAKVISVDYAEDVVLVQDYNGFIFAFEGCEDWFEGDGASMVMDDNGTPEDITDDVILMAHYCGWDLER